VASFEVMCADAALAKYCAYCDDAADMLGDKLTEFIVQRHEVRRSVSVYV
jgi:hypothetical protein